MLNILSKNDFYFSLPHQLRISTVISWTVVKRP